MKFRCLRCSLARAAGVALTLMFVAAHAETDGSYGDELVKVYNAYQAIRAHKEACDEALPGSRKVTDRSYAGWRDRHAKLIGELDNRLAAMIRGASKDDREFVRNFGRIEGVLLKQRTDTKQALLAQPRPQLQSLCDALPALLDSKDSDLEALYAEELKRIRSRR